MGKQLESQEMSLWDRFKAWLNDALDTVAEITTRIAKILKDLATIATSLATIKKHWAYA